MNYTEILQRAEKRRKQIGYDVSRLENEASLLEQVIHATQIPSEAQLTVLLSQYRLLYKK